MCRYLLILRHSYGKSEAVLYPLDKEEPKKHYQLDNMSYLSGELRAIIATLQYIPKQSRLLIHTRIGYICGGLDKYRHLWERNGWYTVDGNLLSDSDAWAKINKLSQIKDIEISAFSNEQTCAKLVCEYLKVEYHGDIVVK